LSLEHFIEQEILAAHAGARKEWAKKQGRDLLAIDDQREIEAHARAKNALQSAINFSPEFIAAFAPGRLQSSSRVIYFAPMRSDKKRFRL
jgi:hypothetical protein